MKNTKLLCPARRMFPQTQYVENVALLEKEKKFSNYDFSGCNYCIFARQIKRGLLKAED